MADYTKGILSSSGPIGSPILAVRNDATTDDAGANASLGRIQCNSVGELNVDTEGNRPTFQFSVASFTPYASTTDVFSISGSASAVIKIKMLKIVALATAGKTIDILGIKRSTANTSGTSSAITPAPLDSNNAAIPGDVSILKWTAAPTLGTSVATIKAEKYTVQALDTGANPQQLVWEWGNQNDQTLVLRGIAQVFALNLNTLTVPSGMVMVISGELIVEPLTA